MKYSTIATEFLPMKLELETESQRLKNLVLCAIKWVCTEGIKMLEQLPYNLSMR